MNHRCRGREGSEEPMYSGLRSNQSLLLTGFPALGELVNSRGTSNFSKVKIKISLSHYFFFLYCFVLKQSLVYEASLELAKEPKMSVSFRSSSLLLPSAGIAGIGLHIQL